MHRRLAAILLLVPFVLAVSALPARAGGGGLYCAFGKLTEGRTNTVDMKDYCFFPSVVRVERGEMVTWENYDAGAHTVTAPGNWSAESKEYLTGEKVSFQFDDEGVFPYVCLLHPGMVGAVVVGDGEGPPGASSSIEQVAPPETNAAAGDASGADSAPASATEDSGFSTLLITTIVSGAAVMLYLLVVWARRRFAERHPRPVA